MIRVDWLALRSFGLLGLFCLLPLALGCFGLLRLGLLWLEWTEEWMDEWTEEWTGEWMVEWMDAWIYAWVDGWADGWMYGWMGGWWLV